MRNDLNMPSNGRPPQYIIVLSMLYLATFIFPMIMAYRMVQIGDFMLPGGTIFFASSYFFSDIISEVYGYQTSRQIVWAGLIVQLVLAILIQVILILPQPINWKFEPDYNFVLGHSLRYAIASTVGNFFGEFLNIFIITKFKVLWRGKHFWARSITSTFFGEGILTIVVFCITFEGLKTSHELWQLVISGYAYKMMFAIVVAYPAQRITSLLKKKEKLDVYDISTNFNPFKFKIDQPVYNKAVELGGSHGNT